MFLIKIIFINITLSFIIASDIFFLKPIAFVDYVSEGDDYVISKKPITLFGAGLNAYYKKQYPWRNMPHQRKYMMGDI